MTRPDLDRAPLAISRREFRTVMAGLLLVLTLASLDQNIVATALPGIVSELGGLAHLSWVVTAFLVASTATTPLYGKLSDSFGRRPLFFVAVLVFLAGSALCGLAQDMGQLIAFRAVQGLGAGGLITLAQTTVGDLLAPRERGRYQGLFTAVFAACSVAGPLLGGFITDALSWRWIFYINLPVGVLALVLIAVALGHPNRVVRHRIDFAGAALMVGGTVFTILVLTLDTSREAWSRPGTWLEAAAAAVCFGLLVLCERQAAEPILPPRLFRDRVFVVGATVVGLTAVALFGAVVFLPLFFQLVLGAAASRAGLMLSPLMGGVIVASVVGGRLVTRTGRYKFLPVTGLSVACAAFLLLAWLAQSRASLLPLELSLVGLGLGLGLVMPNLTTAIQNAVAPEDLGVATSAASYFRSLGGALGVALSGAWMTARLHRLLPPGPGGFGEGAVDRSMAAISALPEAQRALVVQAYRQAIGSTFLLGAAVAALGLFIVLAMPERPLRSATDHRAQGVEAEPA
ncbi:MAG TPA: MDR family MFS transporter [Myxococcaceae bacterium]|nr:MDR family MFS transporter [Myxococcaceae bacterium]